MKPALVALLTLLSAPAFAAPRTPRLYDLRYKVTPGTRVAFDVAITHVGSGRMVLTSQLRTRPGQWGALETGHAGRTIRVRAMGESNGYAELLLEVRERGRIVQSETFKYTERAAAPPTKYRGERISLHLRDADLKDTILMIAEISGTSIAIDPHVSGRVTIDLVDVPWDQALDLILKQHGLARQVEGRVMFVRPLP